MSFTKYYFRQRIKQKIINWLFFLEHPGQVQPTTYVEQPQNIKLKEGAKLGQWTKLYATKNGTITIGRNSHVGTDTIIYTFSSTGEPDESVYIGDGVLVGAKCVILKGVRVGNGCIIGAGSVVLENTTTGENELWAGVPAKFIKKIQTMGSQPIAEVS